MSNAGHRSSRVIKSRDDTRSGEMGGLYRKLDGPAGTDNQMTPQVIHPHTAPDQHRQVLLALIRAKFPHGGLIRYTMWTPDGKGGITDLGGEHERAEIYKYLSCDRQSGWAFMYDRDTGEIEYWLRN